MEDVPASYLLWLWEEGYWNKPGELHDYIAESFTALLMDAPDFIVKHKPVKKI